MARAGVTAWSRRETQRVPASRERIDGVTADQSHDLAERLVAGNQHPARP